MILNVGFHMILNVGINMTTNVVIYVTTNVGICMTTNVRPVDECLATCLICPLLFRISWFSRISKYPRIFRCALFPMFMFFQDSSVHHIFSYDQFFFIISWYSGISEYSVFFKCPWFLYHDSPEFTGTSDLFKWPASFQYHDFLEIRVPPNFSNVQFCSNIKIFWNFRVPLIFLYVIFF